MFEKEAEEYVKAFTDRSHIWSNDKLMQLQLREAYKDGAEFTYNKANEWHYVKGGIFPKDEKDILCLINFETYEVGYYHQEKRCFYTIDGREIDVIAWKEIILPELEESESC